MKQLTDILDIKYPIIMAPMFLVSNTTMVIAALENGITGAIPALNFRTTQELSTAIRDIKSRSSKPFGINLIANKSNPMLDAQLKVCLDERVDYLITSLGNPKKIIEEAHKVGTKVFCDVVDGHFAQKVSAFGADALIAVNDAAGGHAGNKSIDDLYTEIRKVTNLPIIAAGRISSKERLEESLSLGYCGASIGTIFIPTTECGVSKEYKEACISYQGKDIVMTTKLSGTPCTVINTPYVQKTGTQQSVLERFLNRNKKLKKYVKTFTFFRGMKNLQKAAFSTTYKTVWCAGPSIDDVTDIKPVSKVIQSLIR